MTTDDPSRRPPHPTPTEQAQACEPAWSHMHLWHMQPVRDVLLGLGIFALIIIGQKTSVVTVPLLLAILLAYLFEPVIVWMMKRFSFSRRVSVISIIAGVVLFVIIPATAGVTYGVVQLVNFASNTIENIDQVNMALKQETEEDAVAYLDKHEVKQPWRWLEEKVRDSQTPMTSDTDDSSQTSEGLIPSFAMENNGHAMGDIFLAVSDWIDRNRDQVAQTAAGVSMTAVNRVLSLIGATFGIAFMIFVTVFFFFFTSTEWVQLKGFGVKLLPDKNRERIIDLLVKFDAVISGFIRGRITIAFIQAIVFSIGYFIIGVPGAFILGPVVAVLSIVPYLALIGLPISVSLLALQGHAGFRGEWWWIVGAPTGLYFLGQALDDYVWTPKIQGKNTGMDTPTILFASLAGGALFGVFGLLIAIPIAACVKILIQEVFWPRFKDWAEGRADDPLPIDN